MTITITMIATITIPITIHTIAIPYVEKCTAHWKLAQPGPGQNLLPGFPSARPPSSFCPAISTLLAVKDFFN